MRTKLICVLPVLLLLSLYAAPAFAADKTIGVFVALADNKNQGIVPVPEAIGNGEDPEHNLYWGTAEGVRGYLDHSKNWSLVTKDDHPTTKNILRTRTYRHAGGHLTLYAFAYRGAAIKQCIQDFESAIANGKYDLVVYIGHNALMDFTLPLPKRSSKQAKRPDCAVLCCMSQSYFTDRLKAAGGRPVLLTTQLMYPGAFLLGALAESWRNGATLAQIRTAAGAAYAANQHISKRAGTGVFAKLE